MEAWLHLVVKFELLRVGRLFIVMSDNTSLDNVSTDWKSYNNKILLFLFRFFSDASFIRHVMTLDRRLFTTVVTSLSHESSRKSVEKYEKLKKQDNDLDMPPKNNSKLANKIRNLPRSNVSESFTSTLDEKKMKFWKKKKTGCRSRCDLASSFGVRSWIRCSEVETAAEKPKGKIVLGRKWAG